MKFKLTVAALALIMSGTAFSAVTLTVPENIKVEGLNGETVKNKLLGGNNTYKLNAGEHVLSVRYVGFFEEYTGIGSHDIVRSSVVNLQTPNLNDNETYRLALVNEPKDHDQAKKFAQQPVFAIYNQNNQIISQQTAIKDTSKGLFTDALSTKGVDLTATPAVKSNVVVQNEPQVTQKAALNANAAVSEAKPKQLDQQLIQLWQQASKEERQKFMNWLGAQ